MIDDYEIQEAELSLLRQEDIWFNNLKGFLRRNGKLSQNAELEMLSNLVEYQDEVRKLLRAKTYTQDIVSYMRRSKILLEKTLQIESNLRGVLERCLELTNKLLEHYGYPDGSYYRYKYPEKEEAEELSSINQLQGLTPQQQYEKLLEQKIKQEIQRLKQKETIELQRLAEEDAELSLLTGKIQRREIVPSNIYDTFHGKVVETAKEMYQKAKRGEYTPSQAGGWGETNEDTKKREEFYERMRKQQKLSANINERVNLLIKGEKELRRRASG